MRVDNIYSDVTFLVKAGLDKLMEEKRNYVAPGEMETLKLNLSDKDLTDVREISVELVRKEL